MATSRNQSLRDDQGRSEIVNSGNGSYEIYFTPPQNAIKGPLAHPDKFRKLIAILHPGGKNITFYPYRVYSENPMENRYLTLLQITVEARFWFDGSRMDIEDIFLNLPDIFIQRHEYGLGFRKDYHHIVKFLSSLEVEHLIVSSDVVTDFDKENKTFYIRSRDLNKLRQTIDSITNKSRKIAYSTKSDAVGELFFDFMKNPGNSHKVIADRKELISRYVESLSDTPLAESSNKKQDDALKTVTDSSRKIIKEEPEKLIKLRNDIDLVTLEELIANYEKLLNKTNSESHWQDLFEANPFIVNMAFGVPVLKIRSHAFVGGRRIDGGGDKIVDFLYKNSISNNVAIIEIKKPNTPLVMKDTYRGGVHAPSGELTGGINQILDQIHLFQKNISSLKENSNERDIESYSVLGILIVGKSLSDRHQQKSFELFRGNSRTVQIITFDELLEKLKQLKFFLSGNDFIN